MSKRKPHIEEWLRQAAEQTPEVTPVEVKQQAWDQLNNMLDTVTDVPRSPNSSRFGWWIFMAEILVLVGAVTYLYVGGSSPAKLQKAHAQDSVVRTINTDQQRLNPSNTFTANTDSLGNEIQNQDPASALNTLPGSESIAQQNDVNSAEQQNALAGSVGKQLSSNTDRIKQQNTVPGAGRKQLNADINNAEQQNALASAGGKQLNSNSNRIKQQNTVPGAGRKQLNADINRTKQQNAVSGSGNKQQKSKSQYSFANNNAKQQKSKGSSTSASYWNTDPLEGNAFQQQKNRLFAINEGRQRLSSDGPEALFTKQLFTPVKDSGLRNIPANKTPRAQKDSTEEISGFSIRIAAIAPIAEAYGAALNIEYTFKWRNKWRVRPYAGAEYLTGFNKTYDHRYFDTIPGAPASDYRTDSIATHYVLKGLLYGKAGVQVAYAFPKWEVSAGIEYRYLLKAYGKDTFARSTNTINFQPGGIQKIPFDKKQVTGAGNLRMQLGLDYTISPRLQIGAIYYIPLTAQKTDSTYNVPHAKLPGQTSLQIHARYFLRKR